MVDRQESKNLGLNLNLGLEAEIEFGITNSYTTSTPGQREFKIRTEEDTETALSIRLSVVKLIEH